MRGSKLVEMRGNEETINNEGEMRAGKKGKMEVSWGRRRSESNRSKCRINITNTGKLVWKYGK